MHDPGRRSGEVEHLSGAIARRRRQRDAAGPTDDLDTDAGHLHPGIAVSGAGPVARLVERIEVGQHLLHRRVVEPAGVGTVSTWTWAP